MSRLESIRTAVIEGDANQTRTDVTRGLAEGISAADILNKALVSAMSEVGKRFEEGEYFVPEMLISARAMKEGLAILKPKLAAAAVEPAGKIAIGTVKGDLHDIGKNLVAMLMEGAGFKVFDLGVDVSPEKFSQAATNDIQVIAMSALLTTTMPMMQQTIQHLNKMGVRNRVHVIVGGASVTEAFAQSIGADAFAPDASTAARKALALVKKQSLFCVR
ncbi:MAG: corrinoid protein [Chloroflexi bacterium]|nr:corrinoid protein [Chloroflexota bacterium]